MLYMYIKSTSYDVWSKGITIMHMAWQPNIHTLNHRRKRASELSEEGGGGSDQL